MSRTLAAPLLAAVLLFGLAPVAAAQPAMQVSKISIDDWVAAQGGQIVAWAGRANSTPNSDLTYGVVVDYAGRLAQANGLSLGTTSDGSVSLRKFPDGTGEVMVNLTFHDALTYAYNPSNNQVIFGYTAQLLAAHIGTPGLSSGHLQAKYTVPDGNNPELNLTQVTFYGAGALSQLKFLSVGFGPCRAALGVPEGTPGICQSQNSGLFNTSGGGATADGFPVEHVTVRALGHGVSTGETMSGTPGATLDDAAPALPLSHTTWARLKSLYR
jgi:hypothetical protein